MAVSTFDVGDCCCTALGAICVNATNCGVTLVSGALVTVTQSGVTAGTCTTDGAGHCCVSGLADGTYHVDVTKSGLPTWSQDVTITGGATVTISPQMDAGHRYRFDITGCHFLPLPGATLAINGGTYTSDASGQVFLTAPTGVYSYTVTKSRFTTATGTANIVTCASGVKSVSMGPATGYQCYVNCVEPIKETLNLTDSAIGGVTLTWDGARWYGETTWNYTQICPGAIPPFCATQAGVRRGYSLAPDGTFGCLYTSVGGGNTCPATDVGQATSSVSPDDVSTTCLPFERVWSVDACDCTVPFQCNLLNVMWSTAGATVTVTE